MTEAEDLRQQAARARRLSTTLTDAQTADRLKQYAEELEWRAGRIEAAEKRGG